MRLTSLKRKINTLKIAQAFGLSASGNVQCCGDPTRTGAQVYHRNEEWIQCISLDAIDIWVEGV